MIQIVAHPEGRAKCCTSGRESLVTISQCHFQGKVIWGWNFIKIKKSLSIWFWRECSGSKLREFIFEARYWTGAALGFWSQKSSGYWLKSFFYGLNWPRKTVKYKWDLSCSSSPNLLRASDDQRSLEFEYPELCSLVFKKQRVIRKEMSDKLNFGWQLSRGVCCKRKKKMKKETGGGHPSKHRKKKEELTKLVKLNYLLRELVSVIWRSCNFYDCELLCHILI